jgi:pyrroloquinoline quinone biosynthesis protein D
MSDARPTRLEVTGATRLRFAPHVRFRFDEVRKCWVVLAPERLLLPDEPGVEILKRLDGALSVDAIVDDIAASFGAPREEVAADVVEFLQDFADKGVIVA